MAEDKDKEKGKPVAAVPTLAAEIEIEFGDERNRVFDWHPTRERMRGFWTRKNLRSDELVEELAAMPDIPGQRIRLNYERKAAVIYDPLALPENKELCDKIANIIYERWREKKGPAKEVVRPDLDKDDLKTWLFMMRRRVDAKQARILKGDLPTAEEIRKMPGRIRIEAYNSSSRACKWREEYDSYVDAILTIARQPQLV